MTVKLIANENGGYTITQVLVHPVVYLDHWAVRLFSDEMPLQNRFVTALHRSRGTWVFSTANLMEFTAMTDLAQAAKGEALLLRAIPYINFADTTLDRGYYFEEGAEPHPDAPEQDWMLRDLEGRAKIIGGKWNTHRFLQDAIHHKSELKPLFADMKQSVSDAVMALTKDNQRHEAAKKFTPTPGMTLRHAFNGELLREPHINPEYVFNINDAVDYIHASSGGIIGDLILLDAGWSHKVEQAKRRLRKGGVKGHLAVSFSKRTVTDFLTALESWQG